MHTPATTEDELAYAPLDAGILATDSRVVFFPVRHHSPACARCLVELMRRIRPASVLIEGPSDFNDRLGELALPHDLPIAIYSYFSLADPDATTGQSRAGAFYPFCVYSPEWQAMVTAREIGAQIRFIDLPWADIALRDRAANRYADAEMRQSKYVAALCRELGVEDLDGLWDTMFEIDPLLTIDEFLRRCHTFCYNMRLADRYASDSDLAREAFMASQIAEVSVLLDPTASILVVTGGYHSFALYARLQGIPFEVAQTPAPDPTESGSPFPWRGEVGGGRGVITGIALTPYSYFRLDSLTGYNSGMPNPGFYHQAWLSDMAPSKESNSPHTFLSPRSLDTPLPSEERGTSVRRNALRAEAAEGPGVSGPALTAVTQAIEALRKRGQVASTADIIALETAARALAALRGHARVWRTDIIDGVIGALIKDELAIGGSHPLLDAVNDVFRGDARGRLAAGAVLPPLVQDVQRLLHVHELEPESEPRKVRIELGSHALPTRSAGIKPAAKWPTAVNDGLGPGIVRSRVLQGLRVLGIPGFVRSGGVDFIRRDDMVEFWEEWTLAWTPELDAACIEASVYGSTLADAGMACLRERMADADRDAEAAASILLDACLIGAPLTSEFAGGLAGIIRTDSRFFGVTRALSHLLYLYRYDEALDIGGDLAVGDLLREAFDRSLWLLETIGQPQGMEPEVMDGVRALVETFERCNRLLPMPGDELLAILDRIGGDPGQSPILRGASRGAQWTLATLQPEVLLADMVACGEPSRLGDFLTGLFHLAREAAQRQPELMAALDRLLVAYTDDEYLEALPSLRLAFSYFAPREKHHMARTLLRTLGIEEHQPLPALTVSVAGAALAMAFESRLYAALDKYGIRNASEADHV